jgi:nucleotide-binding universal stress UspA family protein
MNASDSGGGGHLVLGFDGGPRMQNLLRVAADEAVRRQASLAIVMVSQAALDPGLDASGRRSAEQRAEASAHRQLIRAAESVRARHQHVPVTTHHLTEEEARATAYPLSSAQLLVVGTIGRHGRRAFSPESISRVLLKAVRCPVLVVPLNVPMDGGDGRRRFVTAGVGDGPYGAAVIRAARAEALRRGSDLRLFHAYRDQSEEAPANGLRRAADLVGRAVAAAEIALGKRDSVFLGHEDPAIALIRQTREAELLVIGSRPGSLSGRDQESVGLEIVGKLHCPLLVIPDPVADPWSGRPVASVGGRIEPAVRHRREWRTEHVPGDRHPA